MGVLKDNTKNKKYQDVYREFTKVEPLEPINGKIMPRNTGDIHFDRNAYG